MKFFLSLLFAVVLVSCKAKPKAVSLTGEALFRITYNFPGRELTDHEVDSLQNSRPWSCEPQHDKEFYLELKKTGIVVNNELDTSSLEFKQISHDQFKLEISGADFELIRDARNYHDLLIIRTNKYEFVVDLGPTLLGDRWICTFDSGVNGKFEFLILEKYYIMMGDNFDLKRYSY